MDEKARTTVEMTAEEQEQFAAFKAEQERKARMERRKENRRAYAQIVDEQVQLAIPELMSLSEQIKTVKNTVFSNFRAVLAMKEDVMSLTQAGQHSHTFTTSDGLMRLTLGVNTIDAYRDTVEDGIAMVRKYIESMAKDDNSRALVNAVLRLLSRDQKGTLKASRVLQLRKMAEDTGDETFIEGVKIIEESYQPSETKQYIRAEYKDDKGWHVIPLSVTDVM
nr:MAG TPA: Protein of unknown function (DUF3164) [Caudoviricetes sp.]